MEARERQRRYREKNREKVLAAARARYAANPQKERTRRAAWSKANPDKRRAAARARYAANPEHRRTKSATWRKANPEKVKAMNRSNRANKPPGHWRRARGLPDPTRPEPTACECCGRPRTKKALCLDHDHDTGAFRGWLCQPCNTAIALLGDTVYGAVCAVDYFMRQP